ncbi:XRE family transcriptional regulator [Enterobacteria phage IME_EC2]|uniref:XRE family transcriptional regulator n=2 Tax=Murrayvirus EC2 TaxID=2734259 RepID=A0A0A0P388_9CAUD|nr:XRE family transcriptional regulator [Enterobacteria phage IME_EC2]AGZ17814.1 XRE family transcriptional regulator [Enterobacteria phage IME_EC2]
MKEPIMATLKPVCLVKQVREAKGIQQKDLAERVGMIAHQLSRYENGHELPHITNLCRLAAALDVSIADLIEYGVNHD